MCDTNNNNIVNQFDQAVSAFLNGDHQTGTSILHVLQETPGGIAETLLSHVLLCPTGRVLGDYTETGSVHLPREEIIRRVQRHFYAFRLISVEICHSWESKWNALNEELLTFIHVSYVAVNGEILTADATALASAGVSASIGKPLLAEYASLAAIIWKLRVASAVASSSEDNNNSNGDQSRLILQQLRSQLFSSEFIFQHTPYSHRGMVCAVLISIVEEFGLFHKAAIQRCIPFRLHESTRKLFMSEVLAHDDGQAGCAGMLKLCVDLLTDERNRCQITLGDGGDPEHAIIKLGEVIKVLMALLSWRFDDAFWFDGDTIAANISDAGKASMPTSLEISGDNKNDAAWSTVLAAPVVRDTSSSALTADAPLSRLVAPLRDHLYGAQSQDPTQVSELSILSLVGSTVALLGGLQCAEYAKGQNRPVGIDETISVVQSDLLACLVQLSSVHCKFWTPEQRAFYAGHCWALSMRLCDTSLWSICTTSLSQQQQSGAALPEQPTAWRIAGCQAIFRIISSIGTQDSIFYHPNLCDHFINPLKELSLYLISRLDAVTATQEKNWANESAEDDLLESLDLILQGWLKIMQTGTWNVTNRVKLGEVTVGILAAGASDVLQSFMTAKIKLHSDLCVSDDSSETVHAVEYANSNLQLLATIGRESAGSSAFLSTMVETVAIGQYLNAFLDKGQEPPVGLSEAVWYVISICAEFVGDAPDSERPCIAMPFVSQAMRLERRFPDSVTDQITNSPFFSMSNNILSFTNTLVDRYLATGAGHVISPGVCAALVEFFRRYIASFLFADESLQSDYSPVFDVVFDSGALVAKLALKLSIACLHCYTHHSDVVENVGKLFETCITLPPQFSAWMFSSQGESLQTLCTLAFENWVSASGGPMLSGSTRGKVLAFLFSLSADASVDAIQAAVAATNQGSNNNGGGGGGGMFGGFGGGGDPMEAIKKIPLASLDCPLKTLYAELSRSVEGIIAQCASLRVASIVIDVLETLKGGTNGLSSEQASALIFTGGYTQLIEMTFRAATTMFEQTGDKRLIVSSANLLEHVIGFFVPAETYKCVIQLAIELCSFSQKAMEDSHQSVQNASSDMKNFEEDERIGVLTATSTMLYQIATWAVLDFQESVPNADGTSSPESTTVPTLVVNGLLIVLRYLDESTALIPSLRTSIFSLLNEVGVSYTGSLLGRCTEEDSNLVLQAIQFASTSGVSDLIRTACAVMKAFGKHARKHNAQHLANLTLMFLQRLVQMILRESLDPSTIPSVASALFELVELHGVEAFQSTMASASGGLSGQHVCAAARLCEEYAAIDRTSWRRAMNPVTSAVEKCVLAAQGGRVL